MWWWLGYIKPPFSLHSASIYPLVILCFTSILPPFCLHSQVSADPQSYGPNGEFSSTAGHIVTAEQVGLYGQAAVVAVQSGYGTEEEGECGLDLYGSSAWPYVAVHGNFWLEELWKKQKRPPFSRFYGRLSLSISPLQAPQALRPCSLPSERRATLTLPHPPTVQLVVFLLLQLVETKNTKFNLIRF